MSSISHKRLMRSIPKLKRYRIINAALFQAMHRNRCLWVQRCDVVSTYRY